MEPVALWKRAPGAIAIVLLLVGVVAGFGIGYKVGDDGAKSTVNTTAGKKLTPAQVELNRLVTCMANRGVKWPKTPGGPNVHKAPPGVTHKRYSAALVACLRSGVANSASPSTHP